MGVKIDKRIAEQVMGYEVVVNKANRKGPRTTIERKGKHQIVGKLYPYSTNEFYAFGAIQKLNWGFFINSAMGNKRRSLNPNLKGKFHVTLIKAYEVGRGENKSVREYAVNAAADTLPMALCLAMLDAVYARQGNRYLR
jgi:hypothetical protein